MYLNSKRLFDPSRLSSLSSKLNSGKSISITSETMHVPSFASSKKKKKQISAGNANSTTQNSSNTVSRAKEDEAWSRVRREFEFLWKPKRFTTWWDFYLEIMNYKWCWKIKPRNMLELNVLDTRLRLRNVAAPTVPIPGSTKVRQDGDHSWPVLSTDMTKSNCFSLFSDTLAAAYQAPSRNYVSTIPFLSDEAPRSDLLFDSRDSVVELRLVHYNDHGGIKSSTGEMFVALEVLTAWHLRCLISLLQDKDVHGFPNYMKVQDEHMDHWPLMWDALRSAAGMQPCAFPIARSHIEERKRFIT